MSSYRRRLMLANQTEENLVLYGNSVQDGTPTPEAPIDIISIENPTIKVTGNNLCKITRNKETISSKGYSVYVNDDDSITINGTPTEEQYPVLCNNLTLPPGTYTISGGKGGSNTTWQMYVYLPNATQKYYFANHTTGYYTFTLKEEQTGNITLILRKDATFDNLTIYPMLNKGTEALPYEPYEEELITIDKTTPFGKNLIPYPPCTAASIFVDNKNGTYGVNGTLEPGLYYCVHIIKTNLGDYLEHGKYYTMSIEGLNIPDGFGRIGLYIRCINKETSAIAWPHHCQLTSNGFKKFTFCVDKDKYDYLNLFIQIDPLAADLTVSDMLVIPMLNEGKKVLPFEPYIPPITTMRGIADYKDRIYTKDGKVWFEQNIHYLKPAGFSRRGENQRMLINLLPHPNDYHIFPTKVSNFGNYILNYNFITSLHWHLAKTDNKNSQIWVIPGSTYQSLWTTKEEAWKHLTETLGIYPEFQYVLAEPILTEITGALAEKILAIDKTKNITITSENGVSGSVEVIEE